MKTGTDICLQECRASGYPVIEHGKSPLDPDKDYRLTISDPSAWPDGYRLKGVSDGEAYMVDTIISYRDLWESFERGGEGIRSFCDFENCPFTLPDDGPGFMEMASLAGIVASYHGIE